MEQPSAAGEPQQGAVAPAPGWYPYPPEPSTQRYWDGQAWALSQAEKFDKRINSYLLLGYRLESRTDTRATVVKGKRPNHVLHLLLTVFTLGVWAIVWIILSITMHEKRIVIGPESGPPMPSAPPAPPPPQTSPPQAAPPQIESAQPESPEAERLVRLRDSGAITQEEFERLEAKLAH